MLFEAKIRIFDIIHIILSKFVNFELVTFILEYIWNSNVQSLFPINAFPNSILVQTLNKKNT